MSDRRELHPYGLIPVYCAAAILGAVLVSILIDRVMRCMDDKSTSAPNCDAGMNSSSSKSMKSSSLLRNVAPPVVSDYGSSSTINTQRAL
jgi:hypothetical protein